MNHPITLKYKKERVVKTIILTCEYLHLSVPTINFDGCPLEGKSGPEWGHYHTDGVNKICVSERQLMQQNSSDLENTAIHEVIHHFGLMHGSPEEKTQFEKIKNYVKGKIWRPQGSAHFISAEQVREADRRIREDPERYAAVNEDSDYLKFIEGRPTSSTIKHQEKPKEPIVEKNLYKENNTTYKPMSKEEIEETRKRLGLHEGKLTKKHKKGVKIKKDKKGKQKKSSVNPFVHINALPQYTPKELAEIQKAKAREVEEAKERHERWLKQEKERKKAEKEHEKRINDTYTNMDTGFGDEHGENRWNRMKKGLLDRVKEALGIDQ